MGKKVLPASKRRILWCMTEGHCIYCGIDLSYETFTVDHVIPQTRGGDASRRNVVPCCHTCNNMKGDKTLTDLRWCLYPQPGPRFRMDQIGWLWRKYGVDLRAYETGSGDAFRQFWFERSTQHLEDMAIACKQHQPADVTLGIYLRHHILPEEEW